MEGEMEGWMEKWWGEWKGRCLLWLSPRQGAGRLDIRVQTPLTPVAGSGPAHSPWGAAGMDTPASAPRGAVGTQGRVLCSEARGVHPPRPWLAAGPAAGGCPVAAPLFPSPPAPHPPSNPSLGPSFTIAPQTGGNWLDAIFNPIPSAFPSRSPM